MARIRARDLPIIPLAIIPVLPAYKMENPYAGFMAPPTQAVDFAGQQAVGFVIENRTDDPATPENGQIWLRTDL